MSGVESGFTDSFRASFQGESLMSSYLVGYLSTSSLYVCAFFYFSRVCFQFRVHVSEVPLNSSAKVGGTKSSIEKRRTRKKKNHPEDVFVLLEVFFLSLESVRVSCLLARVEKI